MININENSKDQIEIPLNVIKDKILFSLPNDAQIEDDAVLAINQALKFFLESFAKKIKYENKKVMVKNIKNCINSDKNFIFLKKLTEK